MLMQVWVGGKFEKVANILNQIRFHPLKLNSCFSGKFTPSLKRYERASALTITAAQ